MQHNHDETSAALITAAHRLLAEHGAEALTVRRIATEAGMSTMNVYSRFGGKDGVIDELYSAGFERLYGMLDAVTPQRDIGEDLAQMASAYRQFALENPTYYSVMFRTAVHGFEPSPEAVQLALSGLVVFIDRIRDGQQRGVITDDADHDAADVAAWLWATCHGLVSLELASIGVEQISWDQIFDRGVRMSISGLLHSGARHD